MIKFFRKIRQKLLSENKFSKYLIYAIGEIALVMIGILLALQVNNWNEKRKLKNEELKILSEFIQSLKSDLETELSLTIKRIESDSIKINKVLQFTKEHKNGGESFAKYGSGFIVLTQELKFSPQTSTYRALESHGVNLISNSKIRDLILDIYNREYPEVKHKIDNKMINIRDYARPLSRQKMKVIPKQGFELLDTNLHDNPIFWNTVQTAKINNSELLRILEDVTIKVDKLIKELEKEILKMK